MLNAEWYTNVVLKFLWLDCFEGLLLQQLVILVAPAWKIELRMSKMKPLMKNFRTHVSAIDKA